MAEGRGSSHGLIGREQEIEAVAGALDADRPVVVTGEAGVGKTSLVRAAVERAGRSIREGGSFATLAWMPYFALERATGTRLRGDAAWVAGAVERAVGPDVLFVDDAQWVDAGTVDAAVQLCGRVALVVAVRSGAAGAASTVEAFETAGAIVVDLRPLGPEDALQLVATRRPDLPTARARAIATHGAGNPFAIEQFAQDADASAELRRVIATRLDALPASERDAVTLLAIAERPVPSTRIAEAGSLTRRGVAVLTPDGIAIGHALIGEAVLAELDADARRAAHRRVADLMDDPGERARHLAAAGDRRAAHELVLHALAASTSPGERAAHLGLAAETADGPAADGLRIDAAAALRVAGELDRAAATLDDLESDDPEIRARAEAVRARIHWSRGEPEAMREAVRRGLAQVGGHGTQAEALLRAEAVTVTALVDGSFDQGLADADTALALAHRAGADPTRALLLRATILAGLARPGWAQALEAVITAARDAGDPETELSAANNLISGHEMHGRPADGRALAAAMLERAGSLRLAGWERQFAALLANLDLHAGALETALRRAEALLEEPLDPLATQQVGLTAALALVDLGDHEAASRLLDKLLVLAAPDVSGRGDVLYVLAEAALWGGRPDGALARVDAYREYEASEYPTSFLVDVTAGWAAVDAGRQPPHRMARGEPSGMLVGARLERDAIDALVAGSAAAAAAGFSDAASAFAGYHRRGELRAGWAAAEAHRRAGDAAGARRSLEALEAVVERDGFAALLARIQRSLRQVGVRRAVRGPEPHAAVRLTAREREVATLVARGLTNAEIARRLGLGRPTVASFLSNAMSKSGVDSRAQLVATLGELV